MGVVSVGGVSGLEAEDESEELFVGDLDPAVLVGVVGSERAGQSLEGERGAMYNLVQ